MYCILIQTNFLKTPTRKKLYEKDQHTIKLTGDKALKVRWITFPTNAGINIQPRWRKRTPQECSCEYRDFSSRGQPPHLGAKLMHSQGPKITPRRDLHKPNSTPPLFITLVCHSWVLIFPILDHFYCAASNGGSYFCYCTCNTILKIQNTIISIQPGADVRQDHEKAYFKIEDL